MRRRWRMQRSAMVLSLRWRARLRPGGVSLVRAKKPWVRAFWLPLGAPTGRRPPPWGEQRGGSEPRTAQARQGEPSAQVAVQARQVSVLSCGSSDRVWPPLGSGRRLVVGRWYHVGAGLSIGHAWDIFWEKDWAIWDMWRVGKALHRGPQRCTERHGGRGGE